MARKSFALGRPRPHVTKMSVPKMRNSLGKSVLHAGDLGTLPEGRDAPAEEPDAPAEEPGAQRLCLARRQRRNHAN